MKNNIINLFIALQVTVILSLWFLTSCTISFQNVSTHGTANDLIDENQRADPDIKPVITVPLSPAI